MDMNTPFDKLTDGEFQQYNEELAEIDVSVEIDHVTFSYITAGLLGLGNATPAFTPCGRMATEIALAYFDSVTTTEAAQDDDELVTGIAELELNGFEYSFCMAALEFVVLDTEGSPLGKVGKKALQEFQAEADGAGEVNTLLSEAQGVSENA